jgi:hypothetical protein
LLVALELAGHRRSQAFDQIGRARRGPPGYAARQVLPDVHAACSARSDRGAGVPPGWPSLSRFGAVPQVNQRVGRAKGSVDG